MAVLANITVDITTLKKIRPDILRFQYRSEEAESTDFPDEILRAKTTLYREVLKKERREYSGYTEAELSTRLAAVKDLPDVEYLSERGSLRAIAFIMKANGDLDMHDSYSKDADNVDLIYYVDLDADSAVTDDEKRQIKSVSFSR